MTIADLKKKAESGAYVDNNARELDTFKAKYSKPKIPAQAELSNPAQINPNVLSGMDILNAQTGKVNAPVEVEAAAGASLKKAGLTDAYNEWLDKQYANNSTALMDYLNARYDQDRLESRWLGVPVTLPEHSGKGAGAEEVEKAAKKAKMALKLTDEQLNDIFERTKLTGLQEANYYAGRTLSGAASSIAGAAQLAAALPYYGLSVAGGLVDRTAEAAGGSTQFENFFSDTAKNIMTGDPLGANRFANYVNGLVKGKYLSQTQQTISNLAENAGAMIPAIATGNIAGMLGATAAGAEAANFAVFGSGAAGNATQRAMQEGADIGTALSYGVMSGMVEVITEKMFAGIAGMNKSGVIDDLIKGLERNGTMRMLVDTLGEGVEEIVAEVIDPFLKRATYDQTATNADLKDLLEAAKSGVLLSLIMNGAGIAMRGGDISALMGSTEGMTEAETLRNDKYGRLGKTDTGMVDDALNNYNQRIDNILNTDRNEAIKGLIRSGLSGQEGGEAYNLAWDMRQRYAEGEDLTGGELRQLYKANDNEIRQENDAEVERLAKGLAPSLSAALIDNYDNTTSPARYYLEMKNAYNAAQKGEAYKGDFLNANQISAAMQAAQSTQNNVASTKNTGYNLLNDDYIRQMIEKGEIPNVGKQSSSTNAGRENNMASVEQGGSLEARAGEAKGRRPGSFEAQRATKIAANAEVQRAGKVSGQEIHLRGATSEKSFKVIPRSVWSQDESLDKIAQNYKKRGMNVVFIYGNIGLEGGGYARGAHRGNVMYINIADGEATAEQIAAHEYFHDFLDRYAQTGAKAFKKSADEARSWAVQQLVKKIRDTYGDGIDELMSVYAETYFTDEDGNITVDADYILEEILCDAAADIDILAGRKAETQRAPLYGETVREELNRMDEAVTRADTDDGGEKFSRKKENNNDRAKTGNQEETPEQDADSGDEHYSRVTDQNELNRLNSGETMKVYRAMQVIDGKLYPPMAAKVADEDGGSRKLVEPTEIGVWYRSDERPDLADEKGYFKLDKANGEVITARYNPYFHTSKTPLNDQFSSAWERPNLVTVEAEIPVSELTSGYRAEKAKDPVGEMNWHNGPIASALKGEKARRVFLSRWARVLRVVPDSEVADVVARTLDGEGLIVPENVITPSLRAELEKRGVQVSDQETAKVNNGRIIAQKRLQEKAAKKAAREAAQAAKKAKSGNGQNTRFSMVSPIEETDRLVALHNINSDGLAGALELGGLAMPSFAVMNAGTIQRGYGDITIVASKDSINPKNNNTSIYAGDTWTPTFPDVGIKIRKDAAEAAESKVRALLEKAGYDKDYSLALDEDNLQDQITRWGSFEKAYGDKDEFKVAFLQDAGRGIKIPKMEKAYTQNADLATLRKVAQEVDLDKSNNYEAAMGYEPVIRRLIREYRIEKYGEKLADMLSPADKPLSFSDVDNILHAAREFMRRGITEQVDTKELRDRLYAAMSDEGTSAEYQAWLKKLSKDFIERRGVRNNKDLFTPSGNRRSFDQLYDAYTLANIVKAMKGQAKQGRTQFLSGSSSVKGAALKDFKDIEQVRSERNRLVSELDENGKAVYDTFSENTKNLADKIADDPFTGSEILAEVLSHAKTKTAIESYIRREYAYLHSQDGLDLSQIAEEIYELGQEANTLPIEYFEAKLYRAFPLDEALAYIVPDSIDADLKAALENEGLNVIEYEAGNQEDRIDKINSVEGARFSRVTPQQDADYLAAVERGDMETAQRMVDEAAEAAGYKKEVYHGTSARFTVFREYGGNEIGYHVGTKAAADERIRDAKDARVLRLYTKLGNKIQMPDVFGLWRGIHDYVSYVLGEPISDEDLDFLLNVKKATAKYKNADIFKKNKAFYKMRDKVKDAVIHEYKRSYIQEAVKAQREYMLSLGIDTVAYKNRYEDAGNTSYMLFHADQVKSADPVTYDDAGNVIPLSERFNSENDDIRFSRVIYDEQAKKEHAEKAIQHFGKTYNWNETGYITQDGTRIDFSGKHDGAPGGHRTVDHRDISDALGLDYGGEDYSGAMLQFMSEGNIRISPESGGINVMIEPTKAQYERLSDFISRNHGEVIFDVDSEDGTPAYSAEWSEGTRSNKVIEDIKDYFQNGAKPKRSLIAEFHSQFSRVTPQQDADYLAAVERGDMETAQKMVDEAAETSMMYSKVRKGKVGALRRVYHYTDKEFTKFTPMPESKGSRRTLGDGYYISTDENEFASFGKNKLVMYADICNPFERNLTAEQAQAVYDKYFRPFHEDKYRTYEPHVLNKLQSTTGVFDYLKEASEKNGTTTSVILSELGFDGVHDGIEWVAFNSNQLKSADPVTYDDNGNVIPLSERFNAENDDIRYSRATPEQSTIARLEKENAKLRERAEYWQKQTKLTQPKILNHKGVGKIASDLLTEYDSISDKNELHAALFKLGNEILRGREEGHALTWERVTERAETLARDILNNSRVLVNTDEYQEYNELKKYLRDNKIRYQNDGNIPDFPAWRKQHKGLNLRQNEGTPADIAYNELRERFGNALFPEDIINPADQVIRMGEVLNGFEPIFENPYSYDMALAVEETADDIIDRLLNAAEDKSFADKQEERYQALKADSAAKLSEAKAKAEAKQAEAIKALKADNAARLREVRKQRDDKIKTLKEYYAAAKRDRAEAKADSEARSRLLRIVKRLKNRKLPAATRAMLDGYIADIDTVAKSITGKSIEKLSELRDWYTEQIENNPNFVRDEGIEKALQRLSSRKIADMSVEEVADLTNILLGIEHEIREHNKFIESEYKKNIYEAGAQTVMDLQDVKGASLPKLNKLETEMLSPIRAIHRFVGYKDDSPLMIFANELNEGQHKMLDYQRKAYEAFNQFLEDKDFMKSLTGKHATKIKVQGITPTGEAGEAYINPAMRIALAAHAMNPQNMKHIVDGGVTIPDFDLYNKGKQAEAYSRNTRLRFTKSQLEGIAATLTPKERAFLNAVMTYFNTTSRNAINETSEALKGYSLADVENYFPINSDDAFLKNDFEALKFDGTIEGMGFLKDRIRGAANPIYLRDVVTVLNKAIEQHSRYYGLAVPLRNFNKLWNVNTRGATQDLQFDEENRPYTEDGDVINGYISSVKDAMRRAWFDAGENYIEKLVKDLSGVRKQAETFDKLLNMVRGSYAKAVLTLNLGVAVKQAASYPTAAAVLGWRPLARAMADIGRVNMDTINKYTPVQYYRSRGYSTQELGDLAARGKSLPKVLNWIQGMDVVTTRKLWKASEYYVRRANRDLAVGSPAYYNAVAAIYNRVIEETQPNYTTMQRPGLLRSENALLQSLMMFKTQPFQNYNILSDSLGNLAAKRRAWKAMGTPEAKAAYKEAKRTAIRAVTSQFVANAVFVGMAAAWALFRGKTKNYKDDDDEYTWKSVMSKIGRDMVGTTAGMVPFGSEFWELVQSLAFDETYYGIETVTASALSDAGSAIKKAWNSTATIIDDVKNPDKEANWNKYVFQMEGVVNAISKLVGAPVENVTKLLRAVTLHAANAICDDEYEAQYVALRISTDPVTDSSAYIDNLYEAKKNGAKSYTELYNLMVNAGISEEKIKNGMENRMKTAEGVEKVGDLDERYLAPKQETIYQKALRELEQSDTYKAATDEQKKGAKSDLYDLYAQTADGKKMREKIDEGKNYDVSDTDYIEFLLSLHEHDEPTENGNYGSYTTEEIIAALKAMDVSNKEKAYLYSTKNSSKANNPWARYLPR